MRRETTGSARAYNHRLGMETIAGRQNAGQRAPAGLPQGAR
jgi:hypothetical protein